MQFLASVMIGCPVQILTLLSFLKKRNIILRQIHSRGKKIKKTIKNIKLNIFKIRDLSNLININLFI